MRDIQIRNATLDDIGAMAGLLKTLFTIEADFDFDEARQRRGLAMMLDSPENRCVMVADADGEAVGMCTVQMVVSTAEGGLSGLVEDLVVREDFRNEGLGRKLLFAVREWAFGKGATRLQLLADCDNESALSFYRRMGWGSTQLVCLRTRPDERCTL